MNNRPIYYKPFRSLIWQLINEKISRERFINKWRREQEKQELLGLTIAWKRKMVFDKAGTK